MEDEVKRWLGKMEELKKGSFDLSKNEDLSIALMNLISLEEHFYFTAMKTNNQKYLEMLESVRELRKSLLKKIVINPEGEIWCLSKHLLASSMRLIEVGTKELSQKNNGEANMYFKSAFNLYSLFFAINLKLVDSKKLEVLKDAETKTGSTLMQKFSEIVKKVVDCCKE